MKKIFVLPFIVLSMLASCSGSTTKENDSDSTSVDTECEEEDRVEENVNLNITYWIEKGIKDESLSRINLGLKRILKDKRFYNTLEESDKFVELSKSVVDKYRERINKLIEKSDDEEEKGETRKLLEEVDNL